MDTTARFQRIAQLVEGAEFDGWLLYDFRGLNPLAARVLGLGEGHRSRRWFLFVPPSGMPSLIVHRIEAGLWRRELAQVPLRWFEYSTHVELDEALGQVLAGQRRVAMEVSIDVPYASRVDWGTVERVRAFGVEVCSSMDLLQPFFVWDLEDLQAHERAVLGVVRAKDLAFRFIHERLREGVPVSELEIQQLICEELEGVGLLFDHPAIVAFGKHAGDPHYAPTSEANARLELGECVLIDLWAQEAGRPYADITWVGFAGTPPPRYLEIWRATRDSRDCALELLRQEWPHVSGASLDRVARALITERGFGRAFTHRLGHDLGRVATHGDGAHLDDFETHDVRTLTAGLGVTIEPGIYLEDQGVRSEINVYLSPEGPHVTTPMQLGPLVLGGDVIFEQLDHH